VLLRLPHYQYQ